MIGNDIVDLALARKESNWKRTGFLSKIFTKKEQLLISTAENPEIKVWDLWSRKEAAYKIYNRETAIRGYFPLKLECVDLETKDGLSFGKVLIDESIYFTKTEITSQFIYTVAALNVEQFTTIKTLESLAKVEKIIGIPNYIDEENFTKKPVSISHHGRFQRIISI